MNFPRSMRNVLLGMAVSLTAPLASAMLMNSDVTLDGVDAAGSCLVTEGTGPGGGGNISVGDVNACFPTGWTEIIGQGGVGPNTGTYSGAFGNIDFTLDPDDPFSNDGTFVLSWEADPASILPFLLDLAFGLKAATDASVYWFEDYQLNDESGTDAGTGDAAGTYKIAFTNNGGRFPALSNIGLYARGGETVSSSGGDPSDVSEPGVMALLGLGLLSGLLVRRRVKHQA